MQPNVQRSVSEWNAYVSLQRDVWRSATKSDGSTVEFISDKENTGARARVKIYR